MMLRRFLLMIFAFIQTGISYGGTTQPEEAGKVTWMRNLEAALVASGKSGRPVFALFQEIPGCAGCKQFGREVLSDPLIVEAIESEFTPLLIHNNKPGPDAEVLKRFGEPAWNYQVVRFLDRRGVDLIPRRDRVWGTGPLAERMIAALLASKRPVPPWLSLFASEHSPRLQQAALGMSCFWTGEMLLGQIEGVITTEAGFIDGREVALVKFDPAVITLDRLAAIAAKGNCSDALYAAEKELSGTSATAVKTSPLKGYKPAPSPDQKKQLQGTSVAGLRLVGAQATKVNAWIRQDPDKAYQFLTPSQRAQLR